MFRGPAVWGGQLRPDDQDFDPSPACVSKPNHAIYNVKSLTDMRFGLVPDVGCNDEPGRSGIDVILHQLRRDVFADGAALVEGEARLLVIKHLNHANASGALAAEDVGGADGDA